MVPAAAVVVGGAGGAAWEDLVEEGEECGSVGGHEHLVPLEQAAHLERRQQAVLGQLRGEGARVGKVDAPEVDERAQVVADRLGEPEGA